MSLAAVLVFCVGNCNCYGTHWTLKTSVYIPVLHTYNINYMYVRTGCHSHCLSVMISA